MYRTDADGNVSNLFDDGDPGIPTQGTLVDAAFMNEVQEELCNTVTGGGVTLVKGTRTQLLAAVNALIQVAKTWTAAHTWSLLQTFAKGILVTQSTTNGKGVEATGNGTAAGVQGTGGGTDAPGVKGIGGGTNGPGFLATSQGTTGYAVDVAGNGTCFPAIRANAGGSNANPAAKLGGTVDLTTSADSGATVDMHAQVTKNSQVSAWVKITTDGGGGATVQSGRHIASVSISGADLLVNFASAFTGTNNYAAVANSSLGTHICHPNNVSASQLAIKVYDDGGSQVSFTTSGLTQIITVLVAGLQ